MTTQNLAEHVLLITLPAEPPAHCELEAVVRAVGPRPERDIIVSFAFARVLPSTTVCSLIILERRLRAVGRHLVLCSVPPAVMGIFRRVGLHELFQFADDKVAALQSLDRKTHVRD